MSNRTRFVTVWLWLWYLHHNRISAQPTGDQCHRINDNVCHMSLTELSTLQSIERRLSTAEEQFQTMEKLLYEANSGIKCRKNNGERSCYKLLRAELTWSDGRAYCQSLSEGADLVSIETRAEHIFLFDMIQELPHECEWFFTSGRKDVDGVWRWRATGQPFTYTLWGAGQPSNSGGVEDACNIWGHKGEKKTMVWNDVPNDRELCFICEFR